LSSNLRDSSDPPSVLAPSSRTPRSADDLLGPLRGVLAGLMRSAELGSGDVTHALPHLTEVAAQLLDVDRVSVWLFREGKTELACADLYERRTEQHAADLVLHANAYPRYFKALAEERSIAAADASRDPRTSEFGDGYLKQLGIAAMLDAPVLLRGELVGVVCHEHVGEPRRWKPWEELVAGTFADFVAMVLGSAEQNAQARELVLYRDELERRVEERTQRLQESEESVRLLFAASPVAMILVRRAQTDVIALNARASDLLGWPIDLAEGRPLLEVWRKPAEGRKLLDEAIATGSVDRFETELLGKDGLAFWAHVSVQAMSYEREPVLLFGVHDVTDQKLVEEKLRVLATTDALTGALNRRHFFEVAEEELARAERYGRDVSIAMIDADYFKSINDRFGHATGDSALKALVAAAQGEIRRSDVLARYGGEEFAILLPETKLDAAAATMERVRLAVAAHPLAHEGTPVGLAVSIGVVQRTKGETLEAVLRRADEALYAAKQSGRNRVARG
jgi:diguanylate cyclase (GGDEF)-like protein/PAS domain S-box-containing protein